jgi:hypothetical protein
MLRHNNKKQSDRATFAGVKKELAKPRMAKSARIAELKLDTTRIPEYPSITMPGTVDKIIPPQSASNPEEVDISVQGALSHQILRVENTLTDENDDEVSLKKGAHVDITVTDKARKAKRHS